MATGIDMAEGRDSTARVVLLGIEDARILASALGEFPDGASLHPGWGPKAQAKLTLAMQRLRAAVLEDLRRELAAFNAAALARRMERGQA